MTHYISLSSPVGGADGAPVQEDVSAVNMRDICSALQCDICSALQSNPAQFTSELPELYLQDAPSAVVKDVDDVSVVKSAKTMATLLPLPPQLSTEVLPISRASRSDSQFRLKRTSHLDS